MANTGHASDGSTHLARAVDLARTCARDTGDLPFGAVVAVGARVLGEGRNQTASRCDPTAHAEMLALRAAAERRGEPTLSGAVLYSSSEPCPMCLAACYWAKIDHVVYAAAADETSMFGFEDCAFYREIALPKPRRTLRIEGGERRLHDEAVEVLRRWQASKP
jgi:tRNA(Arg) A34 adenosine deaminase TadA